MTIDQLQWASEHDWFIGITACNQGVCVKDYDRDGNFFYHEFFNLKKLRLWAGY